MDNDKEDFWVQYYDGSTWHTVASYARTTDFDNGVFYNKVVTIPAGTYNYPTNAKLRFMCDASGNADDVYIDAIEFRGFGPAAKLANEVPLPDEFNLSQNYPNPFNASTDITFALPQAAHVAVDVYNILGQHVTNLMDGHADAGYHTVTWDASNVASGVYFYRLTTEDMVQTRKMMLLK